MTHVHPGQRSGVGLSPEAGKLNAAVLVVDDEADVRWTVAEVLRESGFSVAEAEDGDVALRLVNNQRYGMVILDLRMPRRDGISFVEAAPRLPPIVVHSAHNPDHEERDRLGDAVVGYLQKPVSPQELLSTVEAVLGSGQRF
jgi:DNA-binding response OmpR family regulator